MQFGAWQISIKVGHNASMLTIKGLKDHLFGGKRISVAQTSTSPTTLGRLSRRKFEETKPLDQNNYLHPKKPEARMSNFPPRLTDSPAIE
jgi:hypothetical protein